MGSLASDHLSISATTFQYVPEVTLENVAGGAPEGAPVGTLGGVPAGTPVGTTPRR